MQPAISPGTLLQNRYDVVQLLGQGGFGRTYLAKDKGRFEERCAIKEFVPSQGEDRFSDKATQLFQREAAILYQISHPQIPQFRATFEEDQRLFLVQDYVDGTTYRDLLDQRRAQGQTFSETEVRQFLQQLLPVLAHIHAKRIIHRDISPDNIILRRSDQLPVLIDFGVVKEVVTRLQTDVPSTTVGKVGYAPSEQMQTGRAYPSSDLYSLAVTALVLLTGQEPQLLFDDVNLSWHWQAYAQVSPELATVLNKALNYRPGDRFQSVSQMAQALAGQTPVPAPSPVPAAAPPLSEMRTVAVARPAPSQPTTPQRQTAAQRGATRPVTRPVTQRPAGPTRARGPLENPWIVSTIGLGSAAIAGLGGWAVVNYLGAEPDAGPPQIQPFPEETPTPTPTPAPTATPTPKQPIEDNVAVELEPGRQQTFESTVSGGDKVNYQFQAQAGQSLSARLRGEGVLLTVLGPDGETFDDGANRVLRWRGDLPEDGQYTVQLSPVEGLSGSDYRLNLELGPTPTPPDQDDPSDNGGDTDPPPDGGNPPDEGSPTDPPADDPPVQPEITSQQVQFEAGATSAQVSNSVGPGRIRRYVVNAQQGQIITVKIIQAQGPVTFDVQAPTGEPMSEAENVLFWQSYLPLGGNYSVDVQSPAAAEFSLEIAITGQPQ
ncbi:MAG: serine/threonine-protein kinase [Cyanobacteria bacterium J06627_15]